MPDEPEIVLPSLEFCVEQLILDCLAPLAPIKLLHASDNLETEDLLAIVVEAENIGVIHYGKTADETLHEFSVEISFAGQVDEHSGTDAIWKKISSAMDAPPAEFSDIVEAGIYEAAPTSALTSTFDVDDDRRGFSRSLRMAAKGPAAL